MFFTNEKEKILKDANLDLQLKIDSLNSEVKRLSSRIDLDAETIKYSNNVCEYYKKIVKEVHTRNLELEDKSVELEHKTKVATKRWDQAVEMRSDRDGLIKELKTAKELKEKFETENVVLKSANKVLSDVNTKVQPIMDENITLKAKVENLTEYITTKDDIITDLKSQLAKNEVERKELLNTIVSFQTKDAQVVQPQIIQPSVIEPTILSSKK